MFVTIGMALACLAVVFLMHLYKTDAHKYKQLMDLLADRGTPLCIADQFSIDDLRDSRNVQLNLYGVRTFAAADLGTGDLLVYSDRNQVRVIIEEFLTENIPAGRETRFAAYYVRPRIDLYRMGANGKIADKRMIEKSILRLHSGTRPAESP